ncbi:uncharacterized protein [Venturia canescens]|uniref:uncharacterized protein isoform X1 n=1 Tax=Venturia canescens TaxID=32260 RepID=UPI001C9C4386|nr:uncharacterized protein LOC122418121 isoform X1 [Venturia canescens]
MAQQNEAENDENNEMQERPPTRHSDPDFEQEIFEDDPPRWLLDNVVEPSPNDSPDDGLDVISSDGSAIVEFFNEQEDDPPEMEIPHDIERPRTVSLELNNIEEVMQTDDESRQPSSLATNDDQHLRIVNDFEGVRAESLQNNCIEEILDESSHGSLLFVNNENDPESRDLRNVEGTTPEAT